MSHEVLVWMDEMSDLKNRLGPLPGVNGASQPVASPSLVALAMLNASVTGQIALLIEMQVPATDVLNLLCEHLGKLLSCIEPEQLRNGIMGEIRRNLPGVMQRHLEARLTTPGGVFVPPAGARVQ